MSELTDIADRLDQIAEDLAEHAIDRLKQSVRSGASKTTSEEKRITQARRAVEKAAYLLRSGESADDFSD